MENVAVTLGFPCWIGVVAQDFDVQRRFYRDVLGLTELAGGPGWVQFDLGDAGVLEVLQRTGEPEFEKACYQVGYAVADIESARRQLVARGAQQVTEIRGDPYTEGRWCYFRDAEGNLFEIEERPEHRAR